MTEEVIWGLAGVAAVVWYVTIAVLIRNIPPNKDCDPSVDLFRRCLLWVLSPVIVPTCLFLEMVGWGLAKVLTKSKSKV